MIDARKELANVALQNELIMPRPALRLLDGSVGAFADTIGVAVADERGFERGLDHAHQRVMHHTINERRRADQTTLRVVNQEGSIAARLVTAIGQRALQCEENGLDVGLKFGNVRRAALAARSGEPRVPEVLK